MKNWGQTGPNRAEHVGPTPESNSILKKEKIWVKKYWVKKKFVLKKMAKKNFGTNKILGLRIFWDRKNLSQKKFWVDKRFSSRKFPS